MVPILHRVGQFLLLLVQLLPLLLLMLLILLLLLLTSNNNADICLAIWFLFRRCGGKCIRGLALRLAGSTRCYNLRRITGDITNRLRSMEVSLRFIDK